MEIEIIRVFIIHGDQTNRLSNSQKTFGDKPSLAQYGCSNVAKLFEKKLYFQEKNMYDFYKNFIFLSKKFFFSNKVIYSK